MHLQQVGDARAARVQVLRLALPVARSEPGERGARGHAQQRQRGQLVVRGLVAHVHEQARQAWHGRPASASTSSGCGQALLAKQVHCCFVRHCYARRRSPARTRALEATLATTLGILATDICSLLCMSQGQARSPCLHCTHAPASSARLATESAVRPFCAESAMPFTRRTMLMAYCSRNSSAGTPSPPPGWPASRRLASTSAAVASTPRAMRPRQRQAWTCACRHAAQL